VTRTHGHVLILDLFDHWTKVFYDDDHPGENSIARWMLYGPLKGDSRPGSRHIPFMNEVQRVTYFALNQLPEHDQSLVFVIYGETGSMPEKAARANTTMRELARVRRRAVKTVERQVNQWFTNLSKKRVDRVRMGW
jgi:hypothetical protein